MPNLRIADLPSPVTAAKSNWRAAETWIGFSPHNNEPHSPAQREAKVVEQIGGGYVLEYITVVFGKSNPGFEANSTYLRERAEHVPKAGRLVAIHRLRHSSRSLRTIMGDHDYEELQDLWAEPTKRLRWSVAFPVTESFDIIGTPLASDILSSAAVQRVFNRQSSVLRSLNDDDRLSISGLELKRRPALNAWIAIEDEIQMAEDGDPPSSKTVTSLSRDLRAAAPEGMTTEQWSRVRLRAGWLADRFVRDRQKKATLTCDECCFDPRTRVADTNIRPRTLLDVHHCAPLAEGRRVTTMADFALLCPICHRIEHERLKAGIAQFERSA